MEQLLFHQDASIGHIILNRPKQRNALSLSLLYSLQELLLKLKHNKNINVVIIKGNGPDFCSGHDLNELYGPDLDIDHFRKIFSVCTEVMLSLHDLPQPVIAQVQGVATAAGCQLVAACDLAVASSDVRFATPGVKLGLFCTTPMVPLSRTIGRKRALEMLFTGRYISAKEAMNFGLVNRIVDKEKLEEETLMLAQEIAQYSPYTISLGKKAFYDQIEKNEPLAYTYAKEVIAMNCTSNVAQKGIKSHLDKHK